MYSLSRTASLTRISEGVRDGSRAEKLRRGHIARRKTAHFCPQLAPAISECREGREDAERNNRSPHNRGVNLFQI
jgi:hypothetical protein